MINRTTRYILQWALTVMFSISGFSGINSEGNRASFRSEEGILYMHYFEERSDSLSGPEIYELQDTNGLTIWFSRHIFKDVCISGECKMIRLWLYWDGAGNYLGMKLPEGEPLTKSDHTEFDDTDYAKLENILRDTSSLLKELKQEDLIIVPENTNPYEVDGYTAATQPGLDQVVVKDAVYTCFTLWHTVYGPVRREILAILDERISEDYLFLLFSSGNTSLLSRAISYVEKRPDFHETFYPRIVEAVLSEHLPLAQQALNYFVPARLSGLNEQKHLAELIPRVGAQMKYDLIWKLVESDKVHETVVLQLLQYFDKQEIGVGSLNLLYRMVLPEHISRNDEIRELLEKLAGHQNAYIRNLTARMLSRN
jgi:hypothetical protein